ncbi:hypothetical protein K438DRAFT_1606290, partial [Mycena galopus ATCC 62051]
LFVHFGFLNYVPADIGEVRVFLKSSVVLEKKIPNLSLKRYLLIFAAIGLVKTSNAPGVQVGKTKCEEARVAI